jgi:beta-lactamase class A
MRIIVRRKYLIYTFILTILISIVSTFYVTEKIVTNDNNSTKSGDQYKICEDKIVRNKNYKFISPILYTENECESPSLTPLKTTLQKIIDQNVANQKIQTASVFLKKFNTNETLLINKTEKYAPGSLLKISIMIAILKMSEADNQLLNKKVNFTQISKNNKVQTIVSNSIQIGQSYTIKELLKYMIVYSDNNAASLIAKNIDGTIIKSLFSDIGLQAPDLNSNNLFLNINELSFFMRVIYNGSYLTKDNSEYALELLSESDYKNGLLKDIPADIIVAHKFGESGNDLENQLHETGIIYANNSPYLITVMTKGNNRDELANFISEISRTVYQYNSTN